MRCLVVGLTVLASLASVPAHALAQGQLRPGISQQPVGPAFSPYLNLLRQGNSTALNYYGLVRPQVQFGNAIGGLQNEVDLNRQLITRNASGAANDPSELTTGHAAVFLNTGGYFLNNNRLGGTQAGGTQGGGQTQNRGGMANSSSSTPAKGKR